VSAVLKDPQPRLRPMCDEDVATVITIERSAYEFPWTERIFRDCLRVGYSCWVLERNGVMEAFGVMSAAAGESHILNLCVRPESHHQGLGRRLLQHFLELAREHRADTALLEVRPSNRPALRLYEGMGFVEVGMRRGYYPARKGREDALILGRALGPSGPASRR